MTSAPKSLSTVAAAGAAMKLAQSITFSPAKIPAAMPSGPRSVVVRQPVTAVVVPGRAKHEPGNHNHYREYGFRVCAFGASRNDDDNHRTFENTTVPDAANMPPTPWHTEILAFGTCAAAVPRNCRTLSCSAYMPYIPECM